MGKGLGLFGNFRKRVGNVVGYKLANSNNSQTQGIRTYQPQVANPQTIAQVQQRMKLKPIQTFYNESQRFSDHAFQGKKVGQQNRQRFISLNMKRNDTAVFVPPVVKGDNALYPIDSAIVAEGSLGFDTNAQSMQSGPAAGLGAEVIAFSGLRTGIGDSFRVYSLADVSIDLIENNPGLADGMEVSILVMVRPAGSEHKNYRFLFCNIVLNSFDSLTSMRDIIPEGIDINGANLYSDDYLSVAVGLTNNSNVVVAGAALYISSKENGSYKYANSRFAMAASEREYWDNLTLRNAAIASYQAKASDYDSDLLLQQATEQAGSTSPKDVVATDNVALDSLLDDEYQEGYTTSAGDAFIAIRRDGTRAVVVNGEGQLVTKDGTGITITLTETSTTSPLTMAYLNVAGSPTVVFGSFQ